MFKFSEIAEDFDEHIKGQLFWHEDFLKHFLPEIASVYMEPESVVYDFGSSTGNVEIALQNKIDEKNIKFRPVEKCKEMVDLYKGKSNVINCDFLNLELEEFSFSTCILSLCFVHPSKRKAFIEKLKRKCKVGGSFIILEKFINYSGYLGTALNRVTWKNKLENGESLEMIINKELSLSGVQYPLSEVEVKDFKIIWAYGDFRSYIWSKEIE